MTPRLSRRAAMAALAVTLGATACSGEAPPTAEGGGGVGGEARGGAGGAGPATGGGGGDDCPFDTLSDPAHCGGCDRPCAPGQICEAGACLCDPAVVAPDYQTEIRPFFETTCDGSQCHQGPSPILGLNLAFDPYGAIVGVTSFTCGSQMRLLVEPGHPERSHVMNKLMGAGMCGGQQMPPNMPQPDATLRMVADWICAGAPP